MILSSRKKKEKGRIGIALRKGKKRERQKNPPRVAGCAEADKRPHLRAPTAIGKEKLWRSYSTLGGAASISWTYWERVT